MICDSTRLPLHPAVDELKKGLELIGGHLGHVTRNPVRLKCSVRINGDLVETHESNMDFSLKDTRVRRYSSQSSISFTSKLEPAHQAVKKLLLQLL